MALKIRKLSEHIGAEIQDIDLNEDQSAETIAAINQAWFDNILRMRGAKLRDFYAIQRWATHFELVLHDNLTRSADATPAFLRRLRDAYSLPVRKQALFKAADAKQKDYLAGFNARNFYFNRGARCERPKCAFDARSLAYVNEHLDAAAERHLGVELDRLVERRLRAA